MTVGIIIKLAITVLILAFLAWRFDFVAISATLSTVSMSAILVAFLAVLIQMALMASRLILVLVRMGRKFSYSESMRMTLEALFFSHTFVSFVGGDAFRIWRINRLGMSLTEASSAVMLDRLLGLIVNHAFLLGSLPWLLPRIADKFVRMFLIGLAIAGVLGLLLIMIIPMFRVRAGRLYSISFRLPGGRILNALIEVASAGRHLMKQYWQLAFTLLLSSLVGLANMVVFLVILIGMNVDPYLAFGCALLVPAVMEITMAPISIAGWGLREGAVVVAFGTLGLPSQQALGSSVVFGLILAAVSLLGGLLWLVDPWKRASLSRTPAQGPPA